MVIVSSHIPAAKMRDPMWGACGTPPGGDRRLRLRREQALGREGRGVAGVNQVAGEPRLFGLRVELRLEKSARLARAGQKRVAGPQCGDELEGV